MQHNARQDTSRLDAKASGRKEIVSICKGANACILYLTGRYAHGLQLKTVAQRQVDMPFLSHNGDLLHREAFLVKGVIHLLPYLKVINRDAWAYDCQQVLWPAP